MAEQTNHSSGPGDHHFTNKLVKIFLESNLSIILILLATVAGLAALGWTPREEDPQIVVPLADVYVNFPGHSAAEVEQLVTTPLEKILYQIDGVEYVYSMSRAGQGIITVRFYVGEDRERSLVKLQKKLNENLDIVPPGVNGWVVKPVEIDDVPVVTLTLASPSADGMTLRRVAEELTQRLAGLPDVSRAYVVGGRPRVVQVLMDPDRMAAYHVSPLDLQRALQGANLRQTAGDIRSQDKLIRVEGGEPFQNAGQLRDLVVGVFDGRPVFLKDVAAVEDGPEEVSNYVRHAWGPAHEFTQQKTKHEFFPGTVLGQSAANPSSEAPTERPAVTIALAKKKGSNAVWVAKAVLRRAEHLRETIVPGDMELVVQKGDIHLFKNHDPHDLEAVKQSRLYKVFYPLMAPLLHSRKVAWSFLVGIVVLTFGAMALAAFRSVPLKMLPFDNKNELLLVLDFDEGTTLERADAAVRDFEKYLAEVPEVVDYTSYVGLASPMDFNSLVRHYYLRQGDHVAELRINLAGKKNRSLQSHAIGLRMRERLQEIADRHQTLLKLVETPPGPPVIASVVAEVYGQPDHRYEDLLLAADTVRARLAKEPGVVDVDEVREAPQPRIVFVTDKEKAALNGITTEGIANTLQAVLQSNTVGLVRSPTERNPLRIELRVPVDRRTSADDLAKVHVQGSQGQLVPLAELGRWEPSRVDQTIYHKNLQRVAYVFAETAGRPPADVVVDVLADRTGTPPAEVDVQKPGHGWLATGAPRDLNKRSFFSNGSGLSWGVPAGYQVDFAGEGEWKITLDVFRDLGLAFAAAMLAIYVLLVAQTGSFVIPVVVMLAIPLTVLGVMPGFWLLNVLGAQQVGGFLDPVYFTATGMIGMIALAGIVTRDAIILVDFIHLSLARGRSLFDAIMESRVVRLRPILLTASAAMLGAVPIIIDPIFSGLAWSLIFGLFASTLFTLFVIPVAYWLLYANQPGHGLPQTTMEQEEMPTELKMNKLEKVKSTGRLELPGVSKKGSKMDSGKPPSALGIVLFLLCIPLVCGGLGFFFYNLFFGRDTSFLQDPGAIFIFLALMIPGGILALISVRLLGSQKKNLE